MRKVLCKNGHFFDYDKGKRCPVCGAYIVSEEDGFTDETILLVENDNSEPTENAADSQLDENDYETVILTEGSQEDDIPYIKPASGLNKKNNGKNICCYCFYLSDDDFNVCPNCGKLLHAEKQFCAICGAEIASGARFCANCGTKQG